MNVGTWRNTKHLRMKLLLINTCKTILFMWTLKDKLESTITPESLAWSTSLVLSIARKVQVQVQLSILPQTLLAKLRESRTLKISKMAVDRSTIRSTIYSLQIVARQFTAAALQLRISVLPQALNSGVKIMFSMKIRMLNISETTIDKSTFPNSKFQVLLTKLKLSDLLQLINWWFTAPIIKLRVNV